MQRPLWREVEARSVRSPRRVPVEPSGDGGWLVRHAPRRAELAIARWARRGRRVATAVAMMTALGFVFLLSVFLLIGVPRLLSFHDSPPRADLARLKVAMYADQAYPAWAVDHPDRACPRSIDELDAYLNSDHHRDPWGTPIELGCGPDLVGGTTLVWVRSAGEDRRFGTADDIVPR